MPQSLGRLSPRVDKRHEIDELHVVCRCARLRALQHDRTERTRRHNRAGAGVLQLAESHVTDPAARLLFLVGKQQAAARTAAERVVAIANGLLEVDAAAAEL